MSKVWNMIILLVGTTLLMKLAGIPTGLDSFLNMIGFTTDATTGLLTFTGSQSTLWVSIGIILAASVASAIVVGFFTKASLEWTIVAPFATGTLILFVATFVSIINYASGFDSWIYYIALFIYGVLGVGFLFSLLEWVFNR